MTTVFRSCLPRFYSNTNQSISDDNLSNKINSNMSLNSHSIDCSSIISNQNLMKSKIKNTTNSFDSSSKKNELINNQNDLLSASKQTKISCMKNNNSTKKRGPCYTRINEKQQPLLKRLVSTIFGEHRSNENQHEILTTKKQRSKRNSKKSILPSKSTIKKQFEDNEKTLRSLVSLLTQIESNIQLKTIQTSSTDIITNENQNNNLSIEKKQQSRNNNRMDDTSSSHSNNSYHHKSKVKHNHQHSSTSKRYTNNRSTKKHYCNKKKQSEDDTLSSSSIISHYSSSSTRINRRKMIDNQQQTQIYPTKINIGTSTQFNNTNDMITSEPSWLDIMREDQTTINAWARIRRRLKPNQQKDILKALMIICANLFEVPIENKHI
ncbi:unnamed protein product [Rotaria sordida]|uniref:Uncharacterized protein n=1 Tax=Rotaria sordida TaxID=392033 RepID=A0A813NKY3_9BILA|nr:unnamed protein product [Rotaria sordida]CAF0802574.1 unnamed protein product [Rotaria sordida]CAF3556468.1 unnamed protein product [Rotaria sordida]CAF3692991.1 unnamed protein product [Rotaria sordida]